MTKNDNSKHFEPSADALDTFVEEVLQAVLDGAWPLCMIDPFRVPCFGYLRDGEHFECVPWQDAADRFVAPDASTGCPEVDHQVLTRTHDRLDLVD